MSSIKLEDYRQGYPRLASFLTLDRNFSILKRYDFLHMRSLLDLQDQLSELQDQLKRCDELEPVQLGLSSRRQDSNNTRRDLLQRIRSTLEVYGEYTYTLATPCITDGWSDKAVQDYNNMLRLPEAHEAQRQNVENWFAGNKPLVRSESACFLNMSVETDYVALGVSERCDRSRLEKVLEWGLRTFPRVGRLFHTNLAKTRDPNIFLFPPSLLDHAAKAFVALFVPMWLVLPTILLQSSGGSLPRSIIYAIFVFGTSILLVAALDITKHNFLIALVTYATLLGAFLAQSP
ncbi:uncharacterized protein FIESC28_01090 [Fusarium coffeatum]|uniref:DUF6594 domain-containing protein n=1 Tax=Fusarium coffeatum TaxID=231269 RepID=A0A366SAS6_9HYPO|nr:uncharacterized protein FIESC28_01090 [Fusarium coffeatum]RBR26062.1 hypothetical protein FIESC28_01090 [Fusarium coffeatum]